MSRDEILAKMRTKVPRMIFYTMELGGSAKQLFAMQDEGLISSQSRYGGNHRQRDWFLTEAQYLGRPTAEQERIWNDEAPQKLDEMYDRLGVPPEVRR